METPQKTDTQFLLEAISFAAHKHRTQRRRDVDATPYINHPLEVARVMTCAGVEDVEVLMAAVLHDTIEDTDTTAEEVHKRFGSRVADIVLEVTDNTDLPKEERKRLQVANAPNKSDDAKMIKVADKICNLVDLKESPPDWSDERIAAYVQFAERVGSGCKGPSCQLDDKLEEEVRNFFQEKSVRLSSG